MAQKFVLTAELQFRRSADVDRYVADLKRKFSDVNINVKTNGTREAVREMNNLRNSVRQTRDSTEDLARTFALSFKRFVSFSIATRFVSVFTSKLDGAFRKAREFEAEMIKVSQVTGKSISQLSDLTDEINRLSTDLGVYSGTLAKVSVMLSQAGFTARDTRVALDTLAKTELSPTFDNIIDTTEGAIAIFNQFGKGADALKSQLGSLNKIAGAFAVESGDLVQAVRRVGGVFRSSGGDLNELMSLFTSVRQTTRENAESIATALKTIFVRIQRPKSIEYLKQFGIELTDAAGRFVGPLEAIEEIYRKFGNLPQGDLRLIEAGEVLAGFRQIGKFIPLIQQYRITQEALNVAKAGENSLDEDAAKAKEGLANRLSRLNEEFLLLIRNISESKTFKVVTDFFIDTTSAVIKLVDALRPLIPLFTAFAGIKLAKVAGGFSRNFTNELGRARTLALNQGGNVPGYGNTDTVPAMLTPGEFVINKRAAKTIGANKLHQMNKSPQRLSKGGPVKDIVDQKPSLKDYYDAEKGGDYEDSYLEVEIDKRKIGKGRQEYRKEAYEIWQEAYDINQSKGLDAANKHIKGKTGYFSQNLGDELELSDDRRRYNKIAGALAERDIKKELGKDVKKLKNRQGADFVYKTSPNHFVEVKTINEKINDKELIGKALLAHGVGKGYHGNKSDDEIEKLKIDYYHTNYGEKEQKGIQYYNKGGFVVEDGAIGVISAGDYNKSNAIDKSNEVYRFPSTFSSKDGGIRVAPFGMSVYTLSAKQKLLDLAAKKTAESIKELSQSYGVEDSISGQFSKSQDVTSSFAGYLNEGLISLLTGMQRTGGSNSFDFDLFSNESNLSAAQETFPKIFGRDVLPNTRLIDAKLSSEADTFNKIKAKTIDFIKSMGFNSRKSIEENSGALNLLANYGFKYNPDLEDENLGIKNTGKSVTQANIEQAKEWLRTTSYYTEEYTSSGKVRSGSEGFIFPTESSKIGVRHTNELIKEAHDIDIDNRTTVDKALANLKNKDATLAKIREIFKNEKNKLDERFKTDLTKFAGDRALKQEVDRSIVGDEYAKSSNGAIGYFDTDLMKYAGVKDAARIRLKLMAKAVSSGIPITEIIGSAGAGKTTLAKQIAKEKGKGLYPIFNEEDLNGLGSIINTDSTVSHGKLKHYLTKLSDKDEVIFLSSTTDKEIAALMQNRYKRDSTGEGLFGRKTGATLEADKSTALSEAIVQQYVKAPTRFISVSGRKEKTPVDYDFLSGEKGRLGAQSVGGFSPPTIGHVEGLTRNILRKGVDQEDYLIRASHANPTSSDEKTIRSAIFGERYGFHLAKIGFGDAGFDNVIKSSGFNPELGFVDSYTGRPKVFDIEFDSDKPRAGKSIVATGGKVQENNYTSAKNAAAHGFDDYDSPRSSNVHSEISGSKVRALIKEGTDQSIALLEDYLTPSVYESILLNRDALKHRSNDIDEILKRLEATGLSGPKLKNALEAEFAKDSKYALKFAGGGVVPGVGNRDTVPAMLTPGEFVLNKQAVSEIGLDTLNKQNKGTKRGKSKGRYYFSSNASQTGPTASGGLSFPGGGLGAFAGLSVLGGLFTELIGESSELGKVFGVLQKGVAQTVGSYFLMSQVVKRTADLMADEEGNINKGFLDLLPRFSNTKEFDDKIKELTESFKGFDQAIKNAEAELEAAKLIKDPSQIEEKQNALNEAKRKGAINTVISDPKKLKERIDRDKSDIKKAKSHIGTIDERIAERKEDLKKQALEQGDNYRGSPKIEEEIKKLENKKSRRETFISYAEQRVSQDESLLSLRPKGFKDKLKGLKPDFSTAAGRAKIGGGIAAAGAIATTGLNYGADFQQQKAEKALSRGEFTNARSSLTASKEFADASSIVGTTSQYASAGAAFGPVGIALGATAGALKGFYDVVSTHTEKMQEIDFKIIEESFASLDVSIKQYQEGLVGLTDLYNEQRDAERNKSQTQSAGRTVAQAKRRKSGYLESFNDKVLEYAGDSSLLNNKVFQGVAALSLIDAAGIANAGKARNRKAENTTLTGAILDKDLTVKERSDLIAKQQQERTKNLDRLKVVASDTNLNQKDKVDKVTLEGDKLIKSADADLADASNEIKIVTELLAKAGERGVSDELRKELQLRLDVAKGQERAAKTQKALVQSQIDQVKVQEQLIAINLNKIAVDNAANSATLEFNRTLEEGKSGINFFSRAIEEANFYGSGGSGRLEQLKEANRKSIDSASSSGLINDNTKAFLESQAGRQEQLASIIDEVTTGGIKFDPKSDLPVGQQIVDQLKANNADATILASVTDQLSGLTNLDVSNPQKVQEEIIKALSESSKQIGDTNNKIFSSLDKYNKQIISIGKERVAAERNYISEINNAINLRKEAEQIQAQFGGKTFTPSRERELELKKINEGLLATGAESLDSLSGNNLLAAAGRLDVTSGQVEGRNQLGGGEEQRERLKTQQEALISAAKANIEIRKKEIEIIKEKNRLENDALKSLANGDIESYFNNLQASAATDALAAGDTSILNQLGPKAISDAVANLQSMQSAGITDYNGQNVSGLIRAGNLATANSLGNTALASNIANQNAQISTAESDIRTSAEVLGVIGDQQYTAANSEFDHSTKIFDKAVNDFRSVILSMQTGVTQEVNASEFASGGIVFKPRGTDTVPAMLTPGEFVVRRSAVNKIGVGNLNRLNQGYYNQGGVVGGKSEVYNQAGFEQFGTAVQMFKESVSIFKEAISIGNDVQALSAEISKLRESFMDFANTNMSVQLNPTSVQVNISDLSNSMRQGLSESAQQTIIDRVVEELKRGRY